MLILGDTDAPVSLVCRDRHCKGFDRRWKFNRDLHLVLCVHMGRPLRVHQSALELGHLLLPRAPQDDEDVQDEVEEINDDLGNC